MPEPSMTYRHARDPVAAIRVAVLRTIEERSDNPRTTWGALCASAGVPKTATLSPEQFCRALKYTGTGIQLTVDDVVLVLGDGALAFERFQAFVRENPW